MITASILLMILKRFVENIVVEEVEEVITRKVYSFPE